VTNWIPNTLKFIFADTTMSPKTSTRKAGAHLGSHSAVILLQALQSSQRLVDPAGDVFSHIQPCFQGFQVFCVLALHLLPPNDGQFAEPLVELMAAA
jgi:hypothetical protein